jgi:hypothetical protein
VQKLSEPTTTLTDYALGLESLVLGILLFKASNGQYSVMLWGLAFLCIGAAAMIGGTVHGFRERLGKLTPKIWKIVPVSVGISGLTLVCGIIIADIQPSLQPFFIFAILAKSVICSYWSVRNDSFRYIVYDSLSSIVVIFVMQLIFLFTHTSPGAIWIVAGILVCFFAGAVQLSKFSLHRHLNHNDLYHLIQMAAMYLLYRGGLLLKDQLSI